MGLFGKKEKDIRATYYEGDLPGFTPSQDCKVILSGDKLY